MGKATPRVRDLGHGDLPTFGVDEDLPERTWRSVLRQLVAAGLLVPDPEGCHVLQLGVGAGAVRKGEREVRLRRDATPTKAATKPRRAAADLSGAADAGPLFAGATPEPPPATLDSIAALDDEDLAAR